MRKFLQKYGVDETTLNNILEAYKKDHPDATDLPEYIGKSRFDDVNKEKKALEKAKADLEKQVENLGASNKSAIDEAVKKATEELTTKYNSEKEALVKDHDADMAIMNAHGRNIKAIKALIDPDKKIDDEIARIRKSDAYLFGNDPLPPGTGKDSDGGNPGDAKELEAMRNAVGVL